MKWVVLISSNFINASDYAGGFVGWRGMVKFKPEKNMVFFSISVIMYWYII